MRMLKHVHCFGSRPKSFRKRRKGGKRVNLSEAEMTGRRASSVTAQITRQARRFSTAIAPTLTKIEPVAILQKVETVNLKINTIEQLQRAVELYVMKNSVHFEPVEFDVFDKEGYRIMQASLYPEEIVLSEGGRKICEVTLIDRDDSNNFLKIKHPVSGMTVYELRELGGTIVIQTNTDDLKGARIMTQTGGLSSLCMSCGCSFTKEKWSLFTQDRCIAMVQPKNSFFSENSIRIDWTSDSNVEIRLIAVAFGLVQMVREAFPSLMHIVKEYSTRNN